MLKEKIVMEMAIGLIGGLGLFLYGMKTMGEGLEKAAGDRLKKLIEVLTNNRIMGMLVGAGVTAIIQSSSATTVMVVGFVNAGIMNLTQAIGVIMGANIGTTITGQLISFKLSDWAPLVLGIGVAFWMFAKNPKTKQVAEILIGFGILFIGMETMSSAMKPLREYEGFTHLLASFGGGTVKDTLCGVLAGFALTAIIQSSSASIGILIALASQGLLPIESALPILFGENIGTCVTALLSSLGASKMAKKAALMHFMFNVVGTLIFVVILSRPILALVLMLNPGDVPRQIANTHTLFNIINMCIQLPFAGVLVYVVNKLIKEEPIEEQRVMGLKYLDDRILETPSIAVGQTIKEILHMANIAQESFEKSMQAFFTAKQELVTEVFAIEKTVNMMEKEIAGYLVKLSNQALSVDQHGIVDRLFNTIHDIERVGDHADNLAELALYRIENKLTFSETALGELDQFSQRVLKSYKESLTALKTGDVQVARRVIEREGEIDNTNRTLRTSHISRMSRGSCSPAAGVIFLDMLTNLERIGDHAAKIAFEVIDSGTHG